MGCVRSIETGVHKTCGQVTLVIILCEKKGLIFVGLEYGNGFLSFFWRLEF